MASLVAGVVFPFVSAALTKGSELSYLATVNQAFLQKALSFAAMFFALQCFWAFILYRRDQKSPQDGRS